MHWLYFIRQRSSFHLLGLGVLLVMLGSGQRARAQVATRPDSVRVAALPTPFIFGAYAQGAFIARHTGPIAHLVASHPTSVELNVQRQTTGAAPWHAWYKYPKVGLALIYYDYRNPVLGESYAASVYLSKPISRTARHDFSFRLGTGLAYFTNPYDLYTNRKNNFISSALNATLQFRFEYDLALTEHLGLLAALGLNHYSNGGTTKPNFGINLPTFSLGLNYYQHRQLALPPGLPPAPSSVGHNFLDVSASVGSKQRTGGDPTHYWTYSATVAAGRHLNRKSNLLVGVEGFYDRSLLAVLQDTARNQADLPDVKKVSAFVGHELLFGRLAFVAHLGVYVYEPYKSSTVYYERVGLKYQFTDWFFGDIDLRVHRSAADVIECKLGLRLDQKAARQPRQ